MTANPTNRLYGQTNPVFTPAYSGFVNGDDHSVLSGNPSLTTSATTNSPVGAYSIAAEPGDLAPDNYTFQLHQRPAHRDPGDTSGHGQSRQ